MSNYPNRKWILYFIAGVLALVLYTGSPSLLGYYQKIAIERGWDYEGQ